MPIANVSEMRAYLTIEREKMLDCLARFFINPDNRERALKIWTHWEDSSHLNFKGDAFMGDLRERIERERARRELPSTPPAETNQSEMF